MKLDFMFLSNKNLVDIIKFPDRISFSRGTQMFYAFEYFDGKNTTYGHPKNGRCDIAGSLKAFKTQEERTSWCNGSQKREPITRKDIATLRKATGIKNAIEYAIIDYDDHH